MSIKEFLKNNIIFLDGGMGTLLQERGLCPGELPERWNLEHPEVIVDIHRAYFDAGSNIVNTNTFGANILKFSADELDSIIKAAITNAREAASASSGSQKKFVALDIGPTGKMLRPYGDLDFEDAVAVFAETVKLGVKYGADLIVIETMNDSYETKAALLAAKENSSLPVFVSNAYSEDGKLMTGASPAAMVAMLEGMGADAIGVNCSLGPKALAPIVEEYLKYASVPVLLKPNAGLPRVEEGRTVFDVTPDAFAADVAALVQEKFGYICADAMPWIAEMCNSTAIHVAGIVTFYPGIHTMCPGKYHFRVCRTIACSLSGGEELIPYICEKIGVNYAEMSDEEPMLVSADGLFSVEPVECLANCGFGPNVMVNEVLYSQVTTKKIDEIIAKYQPKK